MFRAKDKGPAVVVDDDAAAGNAAVNDEQAYARACHDEVERLMKADFAETLINQYISAANAKLPPLLNSSTTHTALQRAVARQSVVEQSILLEVYKFS